MLVLLPTEIVVHVFQKLDVQTLNNLRLVCSLCKAVIDRHGAVLAKTRALVVFRYEENAFKLGIVVTGQDYNRMKVHTVIPHTFSSDRKMYTYRLTVEEEETLKKEVVKCLTRIDVKAVYMAFLPPHLEHLLTGCLHEAGCQVADDDILIQNEAYLRRIGVNQYLNYTLIRGTQLTTI